jgi:hypothetical protein
MIQYTVQQLILDTFQRAGRLQNPAGITILSAANIIQDMMVKVLLSYRSDILANNPLELVIPENECSATLPLGFISMSEKPAIYTFKDVSNYIQGLITVYDIVTGALTIQCTAVNGTGVLSDWLLSTSPSKDGQVSTSTDLIAYPLVDDIVVLTVDAGLTIVNGDTVYILPTATAATSPTINKHILQPTYLNAVDDDEYDYNWWTWYGLYGWNVYPPSNQPGRYKIVNTMFYVMPYASEPMTILGRYFGIPAPLTASSVVPFNGLFDDVFREGLVMVMNLGHGMPEVDPTFKLFLTTRVESVINTRIHILPSGRTNRGTWM